jgi:hypothetical protein
MLAFVDMIHALPTRVGKYPIHGFREEKLGGLHFFRGACIHAFGSSFSLEF